MQEKDQGKGKKFRIGEGMEHRATFEDLRSGRAWSERQKRGMRGDGETEGEKLLGTKH
jgi:hypothetical protein